MPEPKLSKLEFQIMEALWTQGKASIREIQETFPAKEDRPTRRSKRPFIAWKRKTRAPAQEGRQLPCFPGRSLPQRAQKRLIDDLLALFGGRTQPVMAHLIESGKLTLEDVKEAQKTLRKLERKDKSQ